MFACVYAQKIPAEVANAPGLPDGEPSSLAEFAYAFSPLVEETASDIVVIDVEGCARLPLREKNSPASAACR